MLRISKNLYVHILTVVLFAVCFFTGRLKEIVIVYSVMTLHEAAHMAAALIIGLKVSYMAFFPFGVNLKLKNKLVRSAADEIILYAAGPLCNAVLALLAMLFYKYRPIYDVQYFYIANTILFAVNLLPAVPLDGGIILKKVLICTAGVHCAQTVTKAVTLFIALALILLGGYTVYVSHFNFSVLLLAVLIIGNMFTQKEKYNIDYVREMMFYKNKSKKRTDIKIVNENASSYEVSKLFRPDRYSLVFRLDAAGRVKNIQSETEIIDNMLKND